jgi:hypothetical protein
LNQLQISPKKKLVSSGLLLLFEKTTWLTIEQSTYVFDKGSASGFAKKEGTVGRKVLVEEAEEPLQKCRGDGVDRRAGF